MRMFVVYFNPIDYPKKYVVRGFVVGAGSIAAHLKPLCVVDHIAEARAHLPAGLTLLPRDIEDEPQIVEVWL